MPAMCCLHRMDMWGKIGKTGVQPEQMSMEAEVFLERVLRLLGVAMPAMEEGGLHSRMKSVQGGSLEATRRCPGWGQCQNSWASLKCSKTGLGQ